ncbi:hypothetical protein IWZ00DRAFT_349256 [Phyllosticta capitalensis]
MFPYRGSWRLGFFVSLPPLVAGWGAMRMVQYFQQLEQKYPPIMADDTNSTLALKTPFFWNHQYHFHTPHVDVFAAKVPARALREASDGRDDGSLEYLWAKTFHSSPLLRVESRLFGWGSPGDCGENGLPRGRALFNGLFIVVRSPEPGSPILMRWDMPAGVVAFFRSAARLGYPWRIMSGGRHECSVGDVDAEGMVEVRFSCAADYEWLPEEGADQKTIPRWGSRLHRIYARWLLDERVRELSKSKS